MCNADYIKAGKIASSIREKIKKKNLVGLTIYEICEEVENEIKLLGGKCAFPVNVSINDIAAHYTAEPNDQKTISERDLVKIDLGVQINGYIADTATTVSYDYNDYELIEITNNALKNAMLIVEAGIKSNNISKIIEETIKRAGYKAIVNLSGHSLDRYTIHSGKSISNIWSSEHFLFSTNQAYACEPFVTTKLGSGFVREGNSRNIFALVSRKKTKNKELDSFIEYIWNEFNMLPFSLRWINKYWDNKKSQILLNKLINKKIVHAYPVLIESSGQKVAQAEHTFIPMNNGVKIITE